MAERSDADLQKIAQEKTRYEPEAYIAAIEELERRKLITPEQLAEEVNTLKASQQDVQNVGKSKQTDGRVSWNETLKLFKVTKDYFYTPIILYTNVAIWALMVAMGVDAFTPSVESLIGWGGNLSSITLDGQPWRLLTSTFLHGGLIHLLLNMYALLQAGSILEIHFGKHRYGLVYLATGIFASVSSAAFSGNVVSVGASGAIFGLYGLLVSLLLTKSLQITPEERKTLLYSTLTFIGYNVFFGFAKAGIDNAAHLGGLVSGFIIGFLYYPFIVQKKASAVVSMSLIAVVLIVVWAAPRVITNSYAEFNSVVKTFAEKEATALWMYSADFPVSGTDEATQFRERLKTEGIDLWNENVVLLNTLNNMPPELQERVELLKKYCQLRIEACEIMQLLSDNQSVDQMLRIEAVNKQIEDVIKSLEALNG